MELLVGESGWMWVVLLAIEFVDLLELLTVKESELPSVKESVTALGCKTMQDPGDWHDHWRLLLPMQH